MTFYKYFATTHRTRLLAPQILCLGLSLFLVSCSPAIAPFSQAAYELAVDLKVDSLRLMDEAEMPYSNSEKKILALQIRLEKAYEFAAGRPKNEHSTEQWLRMNDPDRYLLAGFFKRWKSESTLSWPFIAEAKALIAQSFDAIIGLESGKIGGENVN